MYNKIIKKVVSASLSRVELLKSKGRFLLASIMAGFYVGLGVVLVFSISGLLGDSPYTRLIMGACFAVALSLVVMAGSELFTGNNFIMTIGTLSKKVSPKDTLSSWVICYVGNIIGALIISGLFVLSGLADNNSATKVLSDAAIAKASVPAISLFIQAFLCNIVVCLAVLCSIKMKNEVAKLIMIWWCVFTFFTAGFEHSIANMAIYFTAIFTGGATVIQMIFNLVIVTIGNMVGGITFGSIYYYLGSNK